MCADADGIDWGIVTPEPVADNYIEKLKEAEMMTDADDLRIRVGMMTDADDLRIRGDGKIEMMTDSDHHHLLSSRKIRTGEFRNMIRFYFLAFALR